MTTYDKSPTLGLNLPKGTDTFDYDVFLRQNFNTLDSSLAEIVTVSVKQKGAIGDGIHDDTSAIQSAFDSLANGGILLIPNPSNKYVITSSINVNYSNITVICGTNVLIDCQNGAGFYVAQSLSNVNFNNLHLLGHANSTTSLSGLRFDNYTHDCIIEKCTFDGFNIGITYNYQNYNMFCHHSTFRNMYYNPSVGAGGNGALGYGICLQASYHCLARDCIFEATVQRHALYIGRYPISSGDTAKTNVAGYGNKVINNQFSGQPIASPTGNEYSVKIMGNKDVLVDGNTFDGGIGAIWLTSDGTADIDPYFVKITNNEIKNLTAVASQQAGGIVVAGGSNLYQSEIHDNIIHDCQSHGIGLGSCQDVKVYNNIIFNLTGWTVSGTNINPYGIYVYDVATDTEIYNNKIKSCDRGIYFQYGGTSSNPSTGIRIYGNEIKSVTFGIFSKNFTSGEIFQNRFNTTSDKAILFFTGDFSGTIHHNRFTSVKYCVGLNSQNVSDFFCYDNEVVSVTTAVYDFSTSTARMIKPSLQLGSTTINKTYIGTTAPTTGTWIVGDRFYNTAPVASGYEGWVCVTAGTPGTWKGFGVIQA